MRVLVTGAAGQLGQDVVRGEPVPEDDNPPVDPGVVLAELESLRRSMRMKAYPPRAAAMSPDEQAEALCPRRPQAHHLPDAQLRAARVEVLLREGGQLPRGVKRLRGGCGRHGFVA
jgi:hypothetical protein